MLLDFGGVRVFQFQYIPCIFNDHQLHAVAETKVGNFVFADKLNSPYLPLDTTLAKTPGNNHSLIVLEISQRLRITLLYVLRVHPGDLRFLAELSSREI